MSTINTSDDRVRRRQREDAGTIGIRGSIQTPGLAVQPVTRSESSLLALGEALNVVGSAADSASRLAGFRLAQAEQDRIELERRRAEIERQNDLNRKHEAYIDRVIGGEGRMLSRERLPTDLQDIADRKIIVPNGETPLSVVEALLEERYGEEPAMLKAAREQVAPRLIEALTDQMAEERAIARADDFRALADEVAFTGDTGAISGIVADARKAHPNATDAEVYDGILKPAAIAAAKDGDVDRVNAIYDAAGEGFGIDRKATLDLADEANADREKDRQAAIDLAEKIKAEAEDERRKQWETRAFKLINDGSYDSARQFVDAARKTGSIDEKDADRLFSEIESARQRDARTASTSRVKTEVDTWEARQIDAAAMQMLSADVTGGVLTVEDARMTDSAGGEHEMSRDKKIEKAVPVAMQRIAERYADDPDQAIAQQAVFLGQNAQEFSRWTEVLKVGQSSARSEARRVAPKGETVPVPPQAIAGFELYRRLKLNAPSVLQTHLKDEDTRLFYELAEISLETSGVIQIGDARGADIEVALRDAATAQANQYRVDEKAIAEKARTNNTVQAWHDGTVLPWNTAKINNASDIEAKVRRRAEFYMGTVANITPRQAVAKAVESVKDNHRRSNGYLVPRRSAIEDAIFDRVSRFAAARYAEKYGAEEGVTADDLVLAPRLGFEDQYVLMHENGMQLNFGNRFFESPYLTSRQILGMSRESLRWDAAEQKRLREERGSIRDIMDQFPDPELDALRPARGIP